MYKVVKIPLVVSEQQGSILQSQSKIANDLYNSILDLVLEEREYFKSHKIQKNFNIFSSFDVRNQVVHLKNTHPLYKVLYSSVAKNVGLRLANNIHLWKEALKQKGRFVGFPKHRSFKEKGFFSLKYEEPFVGYKIQNNQLQLSLGTVLIDNKPTRQYLVLPFRQKLNINLNSIKTLEIHQCPYQKHYYVLFVLETPSLSKQSIKNFIALDPNHKNLMVGYDNDNQITLFHNLYSVKIMDKRIDQLKSKRNKCTKNSRRWNYLNVKILDLYRIKREQIKVWLNTVANYLCANYDLIAIGDYIPSKKEYKKMNRAMINQSNIGEMRRTISRICDRSGKTYHKYDEYRTTKTCCDCGVVGETLPPDIRKWVCSNCNIHHDRDENSSRNGYKKAAIEFKLPCSGYLPILGRYTCRFNGQKLARQSRQEIKYNNENIISNIK